MNGCSMSFVSTLNTSEIPLKLTFSLRLITHALMSHEVWSEALHVEISIVLDLSAVEMESKRNIKGTSDKDKNLVQLCDPVKVYVLPKAVKRGL